MSFILLSSVIISVSLSIPFIYKILLIIIELMYGAWVLWQHVYLMSSSSIVGLELLEKGLCQLLYASSDRVQATVEGESTVTAVVCVLRFKVPHLRKKVSCVIFRDALDREMYRQLMVWLRCFDTEKKESLSST